MGTTQELSIFLGSLCFAITPTCALDEWWVSAEKATPGHSWLHFPLNAFALKLPSLNVDEILLLSMAAKPGVPLVSCPGLATARGVFLPRQLVAKSIEAHLNNSSKKNFSGCCIVFD